MKYCDRCSLQIVGDNWIYMVDAFGRNVAICLRCYAALVRNT